VRLLARPGTGSFRTAAAVGVTLNGTEYVLQPDSPASNINTWVYWVITRHGSTLTASTVASHYQAALTGPAPG
jgi:predicted transglutaminase-like protease